jgi:hypothetical protein
VAGLATADGEDTAPPDDRYPDGRHRVDFEVTRMDTFAGEIDVVLPRYTYTIHPGLRIQASSSYVKSDLELPDGRGGAEQFGGTGPGDSSLFFQYDPGRRLPASGVGEAFGPDPKRQNPLPVEDLL